MALDSRLGDENPDLARRLSAAPGSVQRLAARVAAEFVIVETGNIDRPEVRAALTALQGTGDVATVRAEITDAGYAEMAASIDAGEVGNHDAGRRHNANGHALLALAYALRDDPEEAAHDAVYDALWVSDETDDEVERRVVEVLDRS